MKKLTVGIWMMLACSESFSMSLCYDFSEKQRITLSALAKDSGCSEAMSQIKRLLTTGLPSDDGQALRAFNDIVVKLEEASSKIGRSNLGIEDEKVAQAQNEVLEDCLFQLGRVYALVMKRNIHIEETLQDKLRSLSIVE